MRPDCFADCLRLVGRFKLRYLYARYAPVLSTMEGPLAWRRLKVVRASLACLPALPVHCRASFPLDGRAWACLRGFVLAAFTLQVRGALPLSLRARVVSGFVPPSRPVVAPSPVSAPRVRMLGARVSCPMIFCRVGVPLRARRRLAVSRPAVSRRPKRCCRGDRAIAVPIVAALRCKGLAFGRVPIVGQSATHAMAFRPLKSSCVKLDTRHCKNGHECPPVPPY